MPVLVGAEMIKSLHLKGLQSHTESSVDFTSGVNVILGETNAGKTALIRALQWIFQNRPLGTGLTQQGAKECIAEVETDRGKASRIRKKGFNGYVVGEMEFKEIGSSVPDELTSVLDIRDVNLQEQLQPHFLITQPAGQISKYVSELLGFNVTDKMVAAVKSKASALKGERTRLTDEIEAAEREIAFYAEIDRVDALLSEASAFDKEKQAFAGSISRLESMLASLGSLKEDLSRLLDKVDPLAQRVAQVSDAIEDLDQRCIDYSSQSASIKDLSANIVKVEAAQAHLSSQAETVSALDELIEASSGKLEILSRVGSNMTAIESIVTVVDLITAQIASANAQRTSIDADIERAKAEYVGALEESGSCPLCFGDIDPSRVSSLIEGSL